MFGAGLRRVFPRCQSQSSPWWSPWVRGEMWRSFSRLLSGATRRSLRAEGFDTAKDSAFTRRLSQTTACTCKELFLTSPSNSLHREIASRAGGGELCPGRAGDLRGRRDGLAPLAAAAEVPASCLRLSLLAQHSCVAAGSAQLPSGRRRALPEGLRAPRPPTRRKAVVWSVRRPRPAERGAPLTAGCGAAGLAADHEMRRGH